MGKDKGKKKQIAQGSPQLNTMPDGSISWTQPDSNGFNGWEGFCGQTAVANLLTTYEAGQTSPHEVSRAADDWTPGSKPETLMRAINKLAADGSQYELSHSTDLSSATPQNPIVTLLAWDGGGTYHYVSVIGVSGGTVTFNHWGMQDSLSEDEFKKRWGFEMGFRSGVVSFFGGFSPNTSIRHK
ncbi:MAG: hypothetical protein KDK70_34630 [Myxococcales bacterium]|nr:hypothetical protein [Myxococcales bacterium]